jgi:hypothetical protein
MNVALSAEELAEYNALFDAQLDEWASDYEKALHVAFKKSGLPSVDDDQYGGAGAWAEFLTRI